MEDFGVTVRGEHRVADLKPAALTGGGPNPYTGARENPSGFELHEAATSIPDSTVNGGTESGDDFTGYLRNGVTELSCGTCHSVHGNDIMTGGLESSTLRSDPAGNGGNSDLGVTQIDNPLLPGYQAWGSSAKADPTEPVTDAEKIWAFCGDCHNANVNWTAASDVRPNKMTHPGNTDGNMEVYGTSEAVSFTSVSACNSCHSAPKEYSTILRKDTDLGSTETFTVTSDPGGLGIVGNQITVQSDLTNDLPVTSFIGIDLAGYPHQSVSDKLLGSLQNGPAKVDNPDPYRSVPNMDKKCLECHWDDITTPTAGVGISF